MSLSSKVYDVCWFFWLHTTAMWRSNICCLRNGFCTQWFLFQPCGCCSIFNIHNPDSSRVGAASCGFTRWELGSHDNANDYGSLPRGSVIQLTARHSRDSRSLWSESKEKSIAWEGKRDYWRWKQVYVNYLPKCWAKMILQQNHFNAWYFAAQADCGFLLGSVAYPSLVPKCFKKSFTPEHWDFLPSNRFILELCRAQQGTRALSEQGLFPHTFVAQGCKKSCPRS